MLLNFVLRIPHFDDRNRNCKQNEHDDECEVNFLPKRHDETDSMFDAPTAIGVANAFACRIPVTFDFSISGICITSRDIPRITGPFIVVTSARTCLLPICGNCILTSIENKTIARMWNVSDTFGC
jgi:hypothetical protein